MLYIPATTPFAPRLRMCVRVLVGYVMCGLQANHCRCLPYMVYMDVAVVSLANSLTLFP